MIKHGKTIHFGVITPVYGNLHVARIDNLSLHVCKIVQDYASDNVSGFKSQARKDTEDIYVKFFRIKWLHVTSSNSINTYK